jgi:hypothetical protein
VTSRELGSFDFGGWSVSGHADLEALGYSIIELDLTADGGTGLASLAIPVLIDADDGTVSLDRSGGATPLFVDVRRLEGSYF